MIGRTVRGAGLMAMLVGVLQLAGCGGGADATPAAPTGSPRPGQPVSVTMTGLSSPAAAFTRPCMRRRYCAARSMGAPSQNG